MKENASLNGRVLIEMQGNVLTLSWNASTTDWVLESTASLLPPVGWTPVSGAADNRLAVPVNDAMRFYRLRQ